MCQFENKSLSKFFQIGECLFFISFFLRRLQERIIVSISKTDSELKEDKMHTHLLLWLKYKCSFIAISKL